jgi:hypothetical protein
MIFVRTMCVSYSTVSSSTALSILCSHFPPVHLHSLHHAAHAPMSCALNILSVQVKSRIEAQQITIKTRLHELLTRECPGKFIPETRVLRRGARHVLPPNSVCGSTTVCRQWRECEQSHAHNHTHTHTHTHKHKHKHKHTHMRVFSRDVLARPRACKCVRRHVLIFLLLYIPTAPSPPHLHIHMRQQVWIFRPERKAGSGVGIAVVTNQAQLDAAIQDDIRFDKKGKVCSSALRALALTNAT